MAPTKQQLITVPLASLVKALLHGHSDVSIPQDIAETILFITRNKHTCYVQFPTDKENVDITGQPILTPRLWDFNFWVTSSERWQRQRVLSEKIINERRLQAANINLLSRAILKEWPVHPNAAGIIAARMINKKEVEKIKFFLKRELYQSVEQIP